MNQPKAVFLDLDNTLYGYDVCHRAALSACAGVARRRAGLSSVEFRRLYEQGRKRVHDRLRGQAGSHHRLLYFQGLVEEMYRRTDPSLALELYETYWKTYMARMRLAPGARSFLARLKKTGVAVILVSDLTAHVQLRKLAALGIHKLIDFLVTSEEAGAEKPSEAIFRLALDKAGCGRDQVWMVGDSAERDIAGAKRFGIFSVYFQRFLSREDRASAPHSADLCVGSFQELQKAFPRA